MPKYDFNKVANNVIEITLRHGCSPVNLLHTFRTSFLKHTSGWLLLNFTEIAFRHGCSPVNFQNTFFHGV